MNPLLKRLYDLAPAPVQNACSSAFSARLERQRYGGRFPEFRALLEESQWWDARRMGEWQDERLRAVVRTPTSTCLTTASCSTSTASTPQKFRGREDLPKHPGADARHHQAPHRRPASRARPEDRRSPKATPAARPARR